MKVAVIYNKKQAEASYVINIFGPQTMEKYNPKTVELVTSALEKGGHNVKGIEGNINVAEALFEFMPRVMAGERLGMVFNMATVSRIKADAYSRDVGDAWSPLCGLRASGSCRRS
ncbi:hypothetical protein ACFL5K_03625 [Gemmatimonadota bacterium]